MFTPVSRIHKAKASARWRVTHIQKREAKLVEGHLWEDWEKVKITRVRDENPCAPQRQGLPDVSSQPSMQVRQPSG